MRLPKRRILATVVAVLSLTGLTSPPASAANAGTAEFSVIVSTPPMGYPGLTAPSSGPKSFGTPLACAGQSIGKNPAAGPCDVSGGGTITGHCGHASGWLWGSIIIAGAVTLNFHMSLTEAGGAFVGTGTGALAGQTGPVTLVGSYVPVDPRACATGSAMQFHLIATVEFSVT